MYICNMFQRLSAKARIFLVMSFCLIFVESAWSEELSSHKSLVVYFSNFGNTQVIAEHIQKRLNADVLRLEPVVKYPQDRALFAAQMNAEIVAKNYFPALVKEKLDLSQYDVIVVGSPVWNGRAMPTILSFLSKNDFTGKTVYFFSTYSGEAGIAIDEMKKACPNATYGSSLKVELKTPLHDERSVIIPNDVIIKWSAEIMAKQK